MLSLALTFLAPFQKHIQIDALASAVDVYKRQDLEDALKKSIDVVTTGSLKYNKDKAFLEKLRKDRVLLYELS